MSTPRTRQLPGKTITCAMTCLMAAFGGGCFLETPPGVSVRGVDLLAVGTADPPSAKLGIDVQLENPTEKPIQLELQAVGPLHRLIARNLAAQHSTEQKAPAKMIRRVRWSRP